MELLLVLLQQFFEDVDCRIASPATTVIDEELIMQTKDNDAAQRPHTDAMDSSATNLEVGLELVGTRSNVTDRGDAPPDGGYGWVCSVSLLFINAHTWGKI